MSIRLIHGIRKWGPLGVDEEGHRTYKLGVLLRTTSKYDGPFQMYNTPGTPLPGSTWNFGNDTDIWAFCKNDCMIDRYGTSDDSAVAGDSEPWIFWMAEYTFTTKPPDSKRQRCADTQIENPLLEPFKYSGDFKRYTEETYFDAGGRPILNSAWQQIRGQQVEFDRNRPSITIEQNVLDLQLPLLSAFIDGVNDRPMWGLPARTIKLSTAPWEKAYYGTCYWYFKRKLEFEINYDTWDRTILDEGTAVLNGHWNKKTRHWVVDLIDGEVPDRNNPSHFKQFTDFEAKAARLVLDGGGLPAGACIDDPPDFEAVSRVYVCLVPNKHISLRDRKYWMQWKLADGETAFANPPNSWDSAKAYKRGNIARAIGSTFVGGVRTNKVYTAIANWFNINDLFIANTRNNWIDLPLGITNKGVYDNSVDYLPGDYVTPFVNDASGDCVWREPGSIFIQKYPSVNFLLLGVPLILP